MSQKFLKFTSESLSASYIPFPRFLMEDSLAGLSNDAKVLYALMLDRASISKVNGFLETDGTIRIYFTVEQAQKKLHRSRQSATRIFGLRAATFTNPSFMLLPFCRFRLTSASCQQAL